MPPSEQTNDLGLPAIPPEWRDSVRYPRSVSGAEALQHLIDATGVPDLLQAGNALARGELLPALGQGAVGAASLVGLALPAGNLLRTGIRATPGVLADTTGAIRAWHGTPHLFAEEAGAPFGRFKDEAIGSGEGAQAFGYGHYVAGNQRVAENYRPTDDYQVSGFENKWNAFKRMPSSDPLKDVSPDFKTKEEAQQWVNNQSHLLEVHVLPEEHELLDWDKPLSPEVFKKIEPMLDKSKEEIPKSGWTNMPGEVIYQHIANNLRIGSKTATGGQAEASAALHEAGIPGIKYLDAGSRNTGWIVNSPLQSINGMKFSSEKAARDYANSLGHTPDKYSLQEEPQTSNYVIFHPSNLRIVGRNGERLEPVDHDPFAK